MSGFTGSTKTTENIPGDIKGLREGLASFLQNQGFNGLLTGAPDITPYQQLFKQLNDQNFAQVKESSGNLTGTGYANKLGAAAAKADTEQSAFLANLLEQSKQANASRLASVLSSFANTGVAAPTTTYQPGFLDYLTQGAADVAGAAGQAGGFGKLF